MCKCRVSIDERNNDKGDYTPENRAYDIGRIQNRAVSVMTDEIQFFEALDEPLANGDLTEGEAQDFFATYKHNYWCKLKDFKYKDHIIKYACALLRLDYNDYDLSKCEFDD